MPRKTSEGETFWAYTRVKWTVVGSVVLHILGSSIKDVLTEGEGVE